MASKELVPVASKDLALLNDESPCPLWDAELQAVLTDVQRWVRKREVRPSVRRDVLSTLESDLQELVYRVDSGRWPESLPDPVFEDEPDTAVLPAATWRLTDEEISRQFNQVVADHLAWMDAQHQEALREIRGS
jgi:hypothetical protein